MAHILDNPAWNALVSGNKHLSKGNEQIKYFSEDVSPFVGLLEAGPYEFDFLYHVIPTERKLAIISFKEMKIPNQWTVLDHIKALQMVHKHPAPPATATAQIIPLQEKHVPQMIALTQMTHPGPFFKRTIDFGNYEGIFNNNKLIAMAGQRLHADPYTEISAVCTHPDFTGKGYAASIIISQIHKIKAASSIPYLHVKDDNDKAIHLYKTLGFEAREQMDIYMIQKK